MQPPTNKTNRLLSWTLSSLVFLALAAALLGIVFVKRQAITDYIKLRNYQASTVIATLATQDTMTDTARHIFYVNHPSIEDRTQFLTNCPSGSREQTIVLGCYKSDQAGIYLLNVTDTRIDGVKQVTAAHEMLHAAYDRLSSSERQSINKQLLDYYHSGLTDQRIKTTINAYKKSEPNDVVNEMHSIFGTEIAQLPIGLQQYYTKYFTDRSKITDASARYQQEFTSRKKQVAADDAALKLLKQQIDDKEADLKNQQADITAKQTTLTQLRTSNVAAYNAGVSSYNNLINAYNSQVQQVKVLISNYNQLVADRNAIAVEEDQLVKSLSAENQTINN